MALWLGPKGAHPLPRPFPPPAGRGPYPLPGLGGCGDHDGVADGQGQEEVGGGGGAGGGAGAGRPGRPGGVRQGLQPQGGVSHLGQEASIGSHVFFLREKGLGESLS